MHKNIGVGGFGYFTEQHSNPFVALRVLTPEEIAALKPCHEECVPHVCNSGFVVGDRVRVTQTHFDVKSGTEARIEWLSKFEYTAIIHTECHKYCAEIKYLERI